jgi:thiol-disulfide isomerase/thioredoxin
MLFVSLDPNQGEELDKLATLNKLLLRYHSPGCGHCTAMSPEWENVKKDKRLHNAKIKIVDANVGITHNSKHPSAQDVSTKGVPTIYLIDGNSMVEYNGERKQEEIVSFALDKSQSGEKKKSFVRRKRTRRVKRKSRKNTRKRPTRKSKAKRRTKK